jgi:hypothetical protein
LLEAPGANHIKSESYHPRETAVALPSDIPKIQEKVHLVLTGQSAVAGEIDLVSPSDEIEEYVSGDVPRLIERQFRPAKESDQPNLTLRGPNQPWIDTQIV